MKRLTFGAVSMMFMVACSSGSTTSSQAVSFEVATDPNPIGGWSYVDKPTTSATKAGTMEYFGGPVIPNPKVYVVWWGPASKINSSLTAATGGIADFFAGVTDSTFMDWVDEYDTTLNANAGSHSGQAGTNQHVGRGAFAGTYTLANPPSGSITDAQIQSTLQSAISSGALPQTDEDVLYAVYFPSSSSISLDGSSSCVEWLGYHESTTTTPRIAYMVIPDCGSSFAEFTSVSSHELMEATTDVIPTPGSSPDYPQAWNTSDGEEVGDVCTSSSGTVTTAKGKFTVQGIWDELSQNCVVSRNYAQDFNVSLDHNVVALAPGGQTTVTIKTALVGQALPLTLSVTTPAGVTANLSTASVTAGGTATLTLSSTGSVAKDAVVTVGADGVSGSTAIHHSAAIVLQ